MSRRHNRSIRREMDTIQNPRIVEVENWLRDNPRTGVSLVTVSPDCGVMQFTLQVPVQPIFEHILTVTYPPGYPKDKRGYFFECETPNGFPAMSIKPLVEFAAMNPLKISTILGRVSEVLNSYTAYIRKTRRQNTSPTNLKGPITSNRMTQQHTSPSGRLPLTNNRPLKQSTSPSGRPPLLTTSNRTTQRNLSPKPNNRTSQQSTRETKSRATNRVDPTRIFRSTVVQRSEKFISTFLQDWESDEDISNNIINLDPDDNSLENDELSGQSREDKPLEHTLVETSEESLENLPAKLSEEPLENQSERTSAEPSEELLENQLERTSAEASGEPLEYMSVDPPEVQSENQSENQLERTSAELLENQSENQLERTSAKPSEDTLEHLSEDPLEHTSENMLANPSEEPLEHSTEQLEYLSENLSEHSPERQLRELDLLYVKFLDAMDTFCRTEKLMLRESQFEETFQHMWTHLLASLKGFEENSNLDFSTDSVSMGSEDDLSPVEKVSTTKLTGSTDSELLLTIFDETAPRDNVELKEDELLVLPSDPIIESTHTTVPQIIDISSLL